MRIPGARSLSRAARSGLSPLFALLLGSGGCTFLVGAELSDKPEEATGGGGQGGADAASTSAQVTSGPSVASSTGVAGSTGSGGMMCSKDLADCDGMPENGCETNIKTDAKNCGACRHKCDKSESCKESECD
jgi:hypothetical protein